MCLLKCLGSAPPPSLSLWLFSASHNIDGWVARQAVSGRAEDGSVKGDGSVLRCDWLHRFFVLHSSPPLPSLSTLTGNPSRLSITFPFGSYHHRSGLLIHVKHGYPLSPPLPLLSSAPQDVLLSLSTLLTPTQHLALFVNTCQLVLPKITPRPTCLCSVFPVFLSVSVSVFLFFSL